uniref:Uncharacterized protein n=1 Tax=Peronospora matthiolae TaxID=2874970 RepID=A0AAV1UWB5_9STRA
MARSAVLSTDSWSGPKINKKKRGSSPNAASIIQSSGPPARPYERLKAAQRRAKAAHELDELLEGDSKVAAAEATTDTGGVDSDSIIFLVATELALARVQVEGAQRQVDMLPTNADEEQRIAKSKKGCYFVVHACALELAIAVEASTGNEAPAFDYEDDLLPTLEYEYRAAGAAASRKTDEVMKATITLNV